MAKTIELTSLRVMLVAPITATANIGGPLFRKPERGTAIGADDIKFAVSAVLARFAMFFALHDALRQFAREYCKHSVTGSFLVTMIFPTKWWTGSITVSVLAQPQTVPSSVITCRCSSLFM